MDANRYPGIAADTGGHRQIEREVVELGRGVWAFVGFATSNFGVIATRNGYVLVDAGDNLSGAKAALERIRELAPGKLQGILLTHSHPDHRAGGEAFLEAAGGPVPVWGHPDFGAEQRAGKGLEHVLGRRFARQFGLNIPDAEYPPNFMAPRFSGQAAGPLLTPTASLPAGGGTLEIDGLSIQCLSLPTETPDHAQFWLPERRILFCGDSAYGSFPNLYPLRGGPYRDVEGWAANLRQLAALRPEALMCGHNIAMRGAEAIAAFLGDYAEALEYVFNETLRGMDAGKTADELAAEIRLPERLRERPYLGEYYGGLSWAVRAIFAHKVGWFDGDPLHIAPLTPLEEAERMAGLAGGASALVAKAREALAAGDERWAAKLAHCALKLEQSAETRNLLAEAYRRMGENILPIVGKNYLLSAARELRGEGAK